MFNQSLLSKPLRTNVPIVNLITSDPQGTIKKECPYLDKSFDIYAWNLVQGVSILNDSEDPGNFFLEWLESKAKENQTSIEILTQNPVEALNWLFKFFDAPEDIKNKKESRKNKTILFFWNSHLFLASEGVQQCICNLREPLKEYHSLLVLLSPEEVSFQNGAIVTKGLPASIKEDVLILEENFPSDEELGEITGAFIESFEDSNSYSLMTKKEPLAIELLRGFTPFQAEQLISLSLSKDLGIDIEYLQNERAKLITNVNGLSLFRSSEDFNDIQGCANIKKFLSRILSNAERSPKAVVFIDEIEKSLAGIQGDLSGVSQDYLGQLLSWMQDKGVAGMLFVGPPGTAKSATAKIAGNEGKIPSIIFDLGGLKGSLVGESEKNLRKALKIINTISQERVLLIATSNNIDILPPELKRRFNLGTWFFDLPTMDERASIWGEYRRKFLVKSQLEMNPQGENWTGAEIRNCCDIANRLGCSLEEASKFIVPVYKMNKEQINSLRAKAHEKYISASYEGVYKYEKQTPNTKQEPPKRDITLE